MKKLITIIVLIASGAAGWFLLEPALSDDIVNEVPIVDRASTDNENQTRDNTSDDNNTTEPEVILDVQTTAESRTPDTTAQALAVSNTETKPNPISNPKVLEGSLTNDKARYTATGDVFVSGQNLSLVNLNSTNVPDGYVYLSNDLSAQDSVRLAKLKGNVGNQNYTIPSGVDAADYKYVLIWCRAFSSLIGYAEIK